MKKLMAVTVGLLTCLAFWYFFLWCPPKEVCECNYKKLKIGMTLDQVELVLGEPGVEMPVNEVPRYPSGPVVQGDSFYEWKGSINGIKVIVGIKDGRVCDKWYWEADL
ncbi:MAG TPA: hypothetical protein VKS79_23850 [Gemmataceae bacterium]|nr:hypothetical protein [Gemmataceae bacterium]